MLATVQQEDVFKAVADPTRRALLDLLAEAERSVSELVDSFQLTQPAISQHLAVLVKAGLATVQRRGRRRIYSINPLPLLQVREWLTYYEQFWSEGLDNLGDYLERTK